jgi:hypothetical protein
MKYFVLLHHVTTENMRILHQACTHVQLVSWTELATSSDLRTYAHFNPSTHLRVVADDDCVLNVALGR